MLWAREEITKQEISHSYITDTSLTRPLIFSLYQEKRKRKVDCNRETASRFRNKNQNE